ncbi:Pentatricopeptide repeat-containing protein [Rhynchospora pubera]|uniref:Pentatricopeptide repeat-containing protein n=1 Tax=Rhynchospora pubera TaxID=906938 RepID=A0AAV8F641_9POAL|nr:Pentatricopeptide repeat-containing protein [Rhynchospora pubera]
MSATIHGLCHAPLQFKPPSISCYVQRYHSFFRKFFSSGSSFFLPNGQKFSQIFQQYAETGAHLSGRSAHARMLTSGFVPTTHVLNCLMHMYVKCSDLDHAHKVFDRMPCRDLVSWNTVIAGNANNGSMQMARKLFDKMPQRDAISWNSIISGYSQKQNLSESIDLFLEMIHSESSPDRTTFAIILKLCSSLKNFNLGIQVHVLVTKSGFDLDVVTGSSLLDMYAKCGYLYDAVQLFREMPNKNHVSWSALIAGCIQNENYIYGLNLFILMQRSGYGTNQSAYASVFHSCAELSSLTLGQEIHAHAIKNNFEYDIVVGTAIVDMYANCGSFDCALRVLWSFHKPAIPTWNAMLVGFARNAYGLEAVQLFRLMVRSNGGFNDITLSGVLSACAEIKASLPGSQIHSIIVKCGFNSNVCVANALLDFYGKCKRLLEASCVFQEMGTRDLVSWNAIIASLEQNGQPVGTLVCFNNMIRLGLELGLVPNNFTYGSVIKACIGLKSLNYGVTVHGKVIKSGLGFDTFLGCSLVDMYCKCGMIGEALKLHERIGTRQLVSWNAILAGFSAQKQSKEAQTLFLKMLESGLKPDNFTYATVLSSCADLGTAGLGRQIHAQILKKSMVGDVYVASTLMDMYAKCGNLKDTLSIFDRMPERDLVTWNAIVCGYASHGHGWEAISMFERMQGDNVEPNHATFVSILRACGHIGLYDAGMRYFDLMRNRYSLEPQLEHYTCMVDIVGRSKGPFEALKIINNIPFEPDAIIWRTLLSVSKICKGHAAELPIAELAAQQVLQKEPEDSSAYLLLLHIYGELGEWGKVSRVRKLIRENGLKKEPGCSWIEVTGEMHTFVAGDVNHPRIEELHEVLCMLVGEMGEFEHVLG